MGTLGNGGPGQAAGAGDREAARASTTPSSRSAGQQHLTMLLPGSGASGGRKPKLSELRTACPPAPQKPLTGTACRKYSSDQTGTVPHEA